MSKVCVPYIRVSTHKQRETGHSLAAQEKQIRKWAEYNGYEILGNAKGILGDKGRSASTMQGRKGLEKALSLACENKCPFVVTTLSRVARNTGDLMKIAKRLDEAGADLVVLNESIDTSTPNGRMFFHILGSVLQFESEITGERVKAIKHYLKSQGRLYTGKNFLPFGWTVDKQDPKLLVEDRREQAIITIIMDMADEGYTVRYIKRYLDRYGIEPRNSYLGGRPKWSTGTISAIIKRERQKRKEAEDEEVED